MRELSLGPILKAALIAGVAAGLVTAVFHYAITEPVIDAAIALEEQLHAASEAPGGHGHDEEPIVSRTGQRFGLFVGFALYGVTWALLTGAVFALAGRRLPGAGVSRQGSALAALAWWSVALLPFLKYPASPPGVGDPETITYRQTAFLLFMALSVAGTGLALALDRYLGGRGRGRLLAAGFLVGFGAVLFVVMPGNPDTVATTPELVTDFRIRSLAGLTLFWAVFGGVFAWRLGKTEEQQKQTQPVLRDAPA